MVWNWPQGDLWNVPGIAISVTDFLFMSVACSLSSWFIHFSSKSSGTVTAWSPLTEWCSHRGLVLLRQDAQVLLIYTFVGPRLQPLVAELLESSKSLPQFRVSWEQDCLKGLWKTSAVWQLFLHLGESAPWTCSPSSFLPPNTPTHLSFLSFKLLTHLKIIVICTTYMFM